MQCQLHVAYICWLHTCIQNSSRCLFSTFACMCMCRHLCTSGEDNCVCSRTRQYLLLFCSSGVNSCFTCTCTGLCVACLHVVIIRVYWLLATCSISCWQFVLKGERVLLSGTIKTCFPACWENTHSGSESESQPVFVSLYYTVARNVFEHTIYISVFGTPTCIIWGSLNEYSNNPSGEYTQWFALLCLSDNWLMM